MARTGKDDIEKPKKPGRLAQLRETYRMAKRSDRWIGWISIGSGLLVWAAFIGLGFLTYAVMKILAGRSEEATPAVLGIAILFGIKFTVG